MQVEWSAEALDDRAAIIEYLSPLNPYAAKALIQDLRDAAKDLGVFPQMGRMGINNTREWVAAPPYVIIYEINESSETVIILSVWHSAQNRDI